MREIARESRREREPEREPVAGKGSKPLSKQGWVTVKRSSAGKGFN